MKALVKVLFDDLGKVAQTFQNVGDTIADCHKQIRAGQETLENDWIGEGAKKFQGEMEDSINPSFKNFIDVMEEASQVTHQIGEVWHEAEEEAKNALIIIVGI
jgi:WXG100 family type VII secretion target